MKRILLFFAVSIFSVYLSAQPLTCNILINTSPYSQYDMCIGDDALLNGNPSGGTAPYEHLWTGGGSQLTPTNTQIATFTATTTGTYSIVYHVTDASSNTSTDTIVINVTPLPNLFTTSSQIICLGECLDLTAITITGDGLIWFQDFIGGPVLGSSSSSPLTINVCPTTTTEYYAMAYIAASGCVKSKKVTITVIDLTATAASTDDTICLGNTTQFLATPGGGLGTYTYSWSPTQNMNNPNISNPLVWPIINTTYTVTVTDVISGCTATAAVTVIVNPQQPPVIHSDTTICYNTCVNLTATGSTNNFNWSTGQNNVQTINVCPITTTGYTVTMTDLNGCTATDNATVTVNPQLTADAGPNQQICYGGCINIGQAPNSASGGTLPYTYSWSSSPGSFTSSSATPNVCPTVTTTYTLTVTDATGCTASDNVIVTVDPQLTANAGNPLPICSGGCVTIGGAPTAVGGTAPFSYNWSPGTGLSCTGCANPNACPTSTTTYFLTVTDAMGCTATSLVTVTVNQLPTAEAGNPNPQTICSGSSVILGGSPTATGGTAPYSYSWNSAPGSFTSTSPNPSVSPTVTTTYSLTVTDAAGCTAIDNILINVNPSPTASAGPPQTICLGTCVSIGGSPTANGGTPAYAYNWSPSGTLTPDGTVPNPTACPLTTTTYNITVTDALGCTASSSVTITVNSATATAVANPSTICDGSCAIITATGGGTYLWSNPPGGTSATINVCPTTTTSYTVTVTAANGCSATSSATVNVLPVSVTATPTTTPICYGQCTDITAVGSGTFQWSNPPGGTNATINVCPTITTTYTVTITAGNGCTVSDNVIITVYPQLIANAGNPQPLCIGGCVTIGGSPAASGGTAPYSYNWSPATGLSCTGCANPNACPTTTTTYILTVTDAMGCSATSQVIITVNQLPTAEAGNPNPQTICSGNSITLGGSPTASGGTAPYTYSWVSFPSSFTSTIPNPSVSPTVTTTYSLTITDAAGCTATDNILINVNPSPTASAGPPQTICYGTCVPIGGSPTASGGTPGYIYNWSPSGTLLPSGDVPNPSACPLTTTTYNVTVTDALGCTASSSVTITVNTVTATATANPSTICQGSCATITATGGGTYQWSNPPGGTSAVNTVCPITTTTYTVTVAAINGCTATASATVTVLPVSVTVTPTINPICNGQCTDITAVGSGSFQWSSPPGGTNAIINVCPTATTTYTVTITALNGCSASSSVTITVNSVNANATAAPPSICQGGCSTITASGGGTYQWSNPPGGTSASVNVCPLITTTYTVTVTGTNGCSATTSATVTVNTVIATASPAVICLGQCANVTANGGITFLWNTIPVQTTQTITVCPSTTTQYCVTVSDANGCTSSTCATVTVNSVTASAAAAPTSICPGGSSTITATGGGTYQWCCGLGTNASVTVSPASTTTYTVTVTNNGCTATAQVTVTVSTLAVSATASPNPICIGGSTTLTATGGGTYQWCCGLGTNNTAVVNPLTTTTYSVTITNGCTASASVTVTVNSANLNISASPPTICAGNSSTLTATGGVTYLWSNGGNTSSIIVSPGTTTSYCVTVTDINGCTASTCTTVTVNANPVAAINPSTSNICSGGSETLTAAGGGTYQWSNPPGGTTATVIVSPSSSTIYIVTVTHNGCTATATAVVNIVSIPVVTFSTTSNPICLGQSTTITATGGTTYQWSNPPGGTNPVITVTPATTTTYTVTVSSTGCTATSSASITVTVNPVPAATVTANPNPVCNGNSVTLTADGGSTYQWSNPPGGTSQIVTVNPVSNTTYTVTVTNTFNCSNTASVNVVVNTINATVSASPSTICQGQSSTLTAGGGTTYLWTGGLTTPTIVVSPASTSTYFVTVTAANGCSQTLSVSVTVNSSPIVQITPAYDSICAGSNSTLTATGGGTYLWNTGQSSSSITVSPGSTTTYTVTVTGGNGCVASATSAVYVIAIPIINLSDSDPDNAICQGQCVTFTAIGASIYSFFINGLLVQGPGGANTYSSCTLNNNDVISVIGSNNGCSGASPNINMTVHSNPTVTITSVIQPSSCGLCDGSMTEVTNGGTNPGPPQWSSPPGGSTATISNLCSGLYSVTVTDINGCVGQASATLNDLNAPSITLTSSDADNIICSDDCPVFTSNGALTYEFFINATSVQGPGPLNSYMACTLNNGDSVYVEGTDAFGCTGFTNIIHMTVNPLPIPFTITGGGQFCAGGTGITVGLNGSLIGVNYQLFITVPPNPPVFLGSPVPGNGGAIVFPNQTTTGTYTVVAINPITSCQNNMLGSVFISQNPMPLQFTVTGGGVYCAGGSGVPVGLSNSEGPFITYQLWIDPGTGAVPDTTVAGNFGVISFGNQTTAGTYTVIATNTLTTCNIQMLGQVTITTSTLPIAYAVTGGGSFCNGGSGVLVGLSGSTIGVDYQLYNNGVPYGVAQPGTGAAFNFGYYVVPGVYTVSATNSTSACTNLMSGSATISVNASPVADAGIDQNVCQWSGIQLNGSGAGINGTYHWSPSGWLSSDNIANPMANPLTSITYYLTVTDINGCTGTDNVFIDLLPFNLPAISASDTGFCVGEPVNATLDAGGYSSYLWNTLPPQTTQVINVTSAGNYIVTVTAANGCSASTAINIIIYPPISAPVILASGPTQFCQPDSIKLYLNNPYYTYHWSSGSINVPAIWVTQSNDYYVTVTDSNGCAANAGPIQVIADVMPRSVISWVDTEDSLTFNFFSYSLYASTYEWNFGDLSSGVNNSSYTQNSVHEFTSVGTYTVYLVAANSCGDDTAFATIVVHLPFSGIAEQSEGGDFSVYPNPAHDIINIDYSFANPDEINLSVCDALGRKFYMADLTISSGKQHKKIDIADLPAGIYFIRLETASNVLNKKIIKN